jgi:hypothetical protein
MFKHKGHEEHEVFWDADERRWTQIDSFWEDENPPLS